MHEKTGEQVQRRKSTSSEEVGQPPLMSQAEHYTEIETTQQDAEKEIPQTEIKTSNSTMEDQVNAEREKVSNQEAEKKKAKTKYP